MREQEYVRCGVCAGTCDVLVLLLCIPATSSAARSGVAPFMFVDVCKYRNESSSPNVKGTFVFRHAHSHLLLS